MSLPATNRVKISSEAVELISMTPVIARDMPTRELVESMLALTGKDVARIRELLARGSFVSGASRLRWQGIEMADADVDQILRSFPDSDPTRGFSPARCLSAVLTAPGTRIEIARAAAEKKRMFRRRTFWVALLEQVQDPAYIEYSYKQRADIYRQALSPAAAERIREAAGLLAYSTLEAQLRRAPLRSIELIAGRE